MIYHILTFYSDAIAPIFAILVLTLKSNIIFEGKRYAVAFLITASIGYGVADVLGDIAGDNLWVYNLLPALFSFSLVCFFNSILQTQSYRIFSLITFLSALSYYLFNYNTIISATYFNSNFYIVFSIIVCINCFMYYTGELSKMKDVAIWKTNHFWFVTCTLFYATASTFIWLFFKPLMEKAIIAQLSDNEMKYIGDLWKLHNLFFFISCISLSIALLWKK